MVSNAEKAQIRDRIQVLMGNVLYPSGIMSYEIDYISSQTNPFVQEIAIYQAALGHLVTKNLYPDKQQALREHIDKLQTEQSAREMQALADKKAWVDKYGDLQYFKKGDKVEVSYGKEKVEATVVSVTCDICKDGKVESKSFHNGAFEWYPCSCPLGQKWAKQSDYMGPSTGIGKSFATGAQTATGAQQIKTYYDKKFVDNLKANTKMTFKPFQPVIPEEITAQAQQLSEGLASTLNGMLGGTNMAGMGAAEIQQSKGLVEAYQKSPEPDQPTGRKFRKDI